MLQCVALQAYRLGEMVRMSTQARHLDVGLHHAVDVRLELHGLPRSVARSGED